MPPSCCVQIEFKQKLSAKHVAGVEVKEIVPSDAARIPILIDKVRKMLVDKNMLSRAGCFSLDGDTNQLLKNVPEFNVTGAAPDVLQIALLYCFGLLPFVPTERLPKIFGLTLDIESKGMG